MIRTCGDTGGLRLDGTPCGQVLGGTRERCPWHPAGATPEQAAKVRSEQGRRGAEAQARQRSMPLDRVNLGDPGAIRAETERVVARLLSGSLSPRAAAAATSALRLAQTVVAAAEFEERLRALEGA